MTLYLRRGARVRKLRLVQLSDREFAARWGKQAVTFEVDGEVQDIVSAAVAALEKEEK